MKLIKIFHATAVFTIITIIGLSIWIQNKSVLKESSSISPPIRSRHVPSSHTKLPCNLLRHPAPMILMSLGRSGTSSMYQVMSTLSGNETTRIFEYTGSSTEKSRVFFQSIPKEDVNGDWLIQYLCNEQEQHPGAGVVAFKWKPYETLFEEKKALAGLELLGRLEEPNIKVVRSKRNLLDVMISRRKHKNSLRKYGAGGKINSHCQKGDDECLNAQIQAGMGIELPTNKLLKELRHLHEMEARTDKLLAQYKVPTIHVSFEKLFTADEDTSEWKRIFNYLGVGPRNNLTRLDIEKAGHAATSVPRHNVTLKNYDEVREVLVGTEFEDLLH